MRDSHAGSARGGSRKAEVRRHRERASATPLQVQRSAAAATARASGRVAPRIQASSLRVSSPSDSAEKEADSTAKKVVGMSIPDRAIAFVRTAAGGVFRQIKTKDKERDERERMKQGPAKWQSPQVARFADTGLFRRPLTAEEEKLKREGPKPQKVEPPQVARFPDTGLFRRPLTADEEKLKREGVKQQPLKIARLAMPGILRSPQPEVQRKAEGMPNLGANVSAEIQAARSGGSPLPRACAASWSRASAPTSAGSRPHRRAARPSRAPGSTPTRSPSAAHLLRQEPVPARDARAGAS